MKQVIQQANQEQIQALAQKDPTLMKDTTTSAGYLQFEQDLQSLTSAGVTSIDLKNLKWGNITQQDASTVKVTTTETWDATAANSVTQQQSDTNVYTLVLLNGSWKITSDEHPDVGGGQSASGSGTQPGTTTIPVDRLSQSENWAGYAATGGTFTDVSATWTVPNVSNTTDSSADATWVGIGGVTSTDLIQAGTEAIVQGQEVSYSAWIETLPQSEKQVALAVSPGDQVNVSIDQQSSGVWQIVMKNLTTGQTYQTTVNYQSSLSSAEWIEESPSAGWAQVPLDDFGSVSFSNATAVENGQTVSIGQAKGKSITLAARNGQALAQTSDLGSDGSSFSVTRTDVSSSQYSSGGRGFQRRGYPGT
ncbi:MAG: G1 family glutamic endopeptidase [Nitrolancea sp.]